MLTIIEHLTQTDANCAAKMHCKDRFNKSVVSSESVVINSQEFLLAGWRLTRMEAGTRQESQKRRRDSTG